MSSTSPITTLIAANFVLGFGKSVAITGTNKTKACATAHVNTHRISYLFVNFAMPEGPHVKSWSSAPAIFPNIRGVKSITRGVKSITQGSKA